MVLLANEMPRRHFSLDPIKQALAAINNPHYHLPPVIHVAGTNGKGSVLAFLKSLLESIGSSVHRYTSPHIINVCERIELNGAPITAELFTQYQQQLQPLFSPLSPFEQLTLVAFQAFHDYPADYLLLETGMGGGFDATNVIAKPAVVAITSISLDHQQFLGGSLEAIAQQKAGICKEKTPVVIAPQEPAVMELLEHYAQKLECPMYRFDKEWALNITEEGFLLTINNNLYPFPTPSLQGEHQYYNAAISLIIFLLLGYDLHHHMSHAATALQNTCWPGRMQHLGNNIWLDAAHNEGGAKALAQTLRKWPHRPIVLIWTMLCRKSPRAFLQALQAVLGPQELVILAIPFPDNPEQETGYSPAFLAEVAEEYGFRTTKALSLIQAIEIAKTSFPDSSIMISGSLYLVKHALMMRI